MTSLCFLLLCYLCMEQEEMFQSETRKWLGKDFFNTALLMCCAYSQGTLCRSRRNGPVYIQEKISKFLTCVISLRSMGTLWAKRLHEWTLKAGWEGGCVVIWNSSTASSWPLVKIRHLGRLPVSQSNLCESPLKLFCLRRDPNKWCFYP